MEKTIKSRKIDSAIACVFWCVRVRERGGRYRVGGERRIEAKKRKGGREGGSANRVRWDRSLSSRGYRHVLVIIMSRIVIRLSWLEIII